LRGRPASSRSRRTRAGSAQWPSDPDDVVTPSFSPVRRGDTDSVHPQPSSGCCRWLRGRGSRAHVAVAPVATSVEADVGGPPHPREGRGESVPAMKQAVRGAATPRRTARWRSSIPVRIACPSTA
jgi:hypothetical protein